MDETYKDFNNNAAYYQTLADTDPTEQAEEYNFAYASYIDARKLFNGIKLSPGYLPIVALTDGGGAASPQFSIFQCPQAVARMQNEERKGQGWLQRCEVSAQGQGKGVWSERTSES